MEITIILNNKSEFELYNEFMNRLLKLRNTKKAPAKGAKRIREQFKTIAPFCIKTAGSVFPAEFRELITNAKKLRVFINNLRATGFIKTCGYTKPKGSTRLYVAYCGVNYDPKSVVEGDGLLPIDPQPLNWDPFSLGGDLGTIKPGCNLIVASSGVLVSKEFANE